MSEIGNDCSFQCSPCTQQQYSHISCFWEKQPSGCVRISCAFRHSKPRNINGLFLPPSNNVPLQEGGQERTHPAHHQESLRNQDNIFLPVHAPLIISLNNDEEDDEEDNEELENYVSNWVPKTAAEIEEERTIKEICYKTGEYYRIQYPHEHQSAETVSSPQEKEILLLEAMERDLQKGDGNTIPTTFNNTKREGEISRRRIPTERIPRRDRRSFENGETNHSELVNKHHSKEIRKNQWISEKPRNSPNTVPGKGFNTSDPKGKPSYQPRGQRKDDETASYVPRGRADRRKTYCDSSEPRRSAYVFYRTADVTREPKFNGSTGDGNISATLNNTKREGETSGRRVPTERIPRRNCRSFDNGGIHTSDPNIKPSYQQRCNNKDDETASSVPYVRATNRKTDFASLEPRRSTYVFYRTVNQEPKFNGSTVPEPYGQKCSKPKNQLDTNRRFLTQMENYDKYTSGFYNAPRWRKRNPCENAYSKFKTTIQRSQEDLGANNKGEQYVDMRKR
nr:uncharacterized protein C12orf50 homolog isoform X4 [Columba livia]